MDLVKDVFATKAVSYKGGIIMYHPQDAVDVIKFCKNIDKKIYGLDAFKLIGNDGIQPFLEFSTDYSYDGEPDKIYQKAIDHIQRLSDKGLYFEVVYEGY
ncbi:MAG: hypothetical protein LBN26_04150 [Christensenellaceae bacterium]|jgi:hypothetical protein|nr:hypothetical protein [Christensenellaceae bacterium]